MITNNTKNELGIYNELIEKLSLSQDAYVNYWTKDKNLVSLIKKGLAQSINKEELKKLGKILNLSVIKKPNKITITLKKGEARKKTEQRHSEVEDNDTKIDEDNSDKDDDDDEDDDGDGNEDEVTNDIVIEFLSNSIPSIISLLALFSHKSELNCSNIEDCLKRSTEQIEGFTELCKCSNITESNIIDCFLNSPQNINGEFVKSNHAKMKGNLISVLSIIIVEINSNELMRHALELKFDTILKELKGQNGALIIGMNPTEIKKLIEDNLTIKKDEKDKFGEVFTPPALINEMLDKLPIEVWSNPDLKWLDPANGIGNFPMIVYERLMTSLEREFPDKTERSKHIITKMLYMAEINPKNVKISKKIFGDDANIFCGDFLTMDFRKTGVEKFDIIIGNPPFQIAQDGKREGGYGGRTLWDDFIIKGLNELLVQNGFFGFITPPQWRKPIINNSEEDDMDDSPIINIKSIKNKKQNGKEEKIIIWNLMTQQNQLIYLHIYNKKQGQKLFHVAQRVDLYVIEKKPPYKKTDVIDELENKFIGDKAIDLKLWGFLPNYAYDNIKKIMTTGENGINIIYNRSLYGTDKHNMCDKKQDAKCIIKNPKGKIVRESPKQNFHYPVVHSINQEGFVFWYSSEIKIDKNGHSHFGESKVLLNFNENQYPVNDFEGKYGMSQITFGIPITSKKEGDDIVKAINTDEFKEIIKATKWGAFQTDWRMFKYFKPDFYKYFLKDTSLPPDEVQPSSFTEEPPIETPPKPVTVSKKTSRKSKKTLINLNVNPDVVQPLAPVLPVAPQIINKPISPIAQPIAQSIPQPLAQPIPKASKKSKVKTVKEPIPKKVKSATYTPRIKKTTSTSTLKNGGGKKLRSKNKINRYRNDYKKSRKMNINRTRKYRH